MLKYLADSAYFVYLVHFPFTILFGAALFELPLPALLKITINISCTTFVCFGSYQLLVRYSWVGKLLSGKRRERPMQNVPGSAGAP